MKSMTVSQCLMKGRSLEAAKGFKGAIKAFESALAINPRCFEAHLALARIANTLQRRPGFALSHARKALALQPKSAAAHCEAVAPYMAGQRRQQALAHAKKAHELDPSNRNKMNLAVVLRAVGRSLESLKILDKLALAEPENLYIRLQLAMSCHSLGNFERSAALARDAYEKGPRNLQAMAVYLTSLQPELEDPMVQSLQHQLIPQLAQSNPSEHAEALRLLASVYDRNGAYLDAIGTVKKARRIQRLKHNRKEYAAYVDGLIDGLGPSDFANSIGSESI